ncbi:MAG: efflux RND transporter periplasmic adaptor subunit [Deltaproteobacteria bacterium]|nr:efflux RND transporter periplasmic adaptor subunit [Deltaproteobacteria bacterium]
MRAPLDGVVIRRPAVLGTFATDEISLAVVADPNRLWVMLDIPESEVAGLAAGAPVEIVTADRAATTLSGRLAWIAPEVDLTSRTVKARVEIENPQGRLRAGQFVRAVVQREQPRRAVAVPRTALQRLGNDHVLFVRVEEGVYEPRAVEAGRADDDLIHIHGDVAEGDAVVTVGAFLLKTELSKESIGAGCCEIEPARPS